jgi:hypothetical protein
MLRSIGSAAPNLVISALQVRAVEFSELLELQIVYGIRTQMTLRTDFENIKSLNSVCQ